MANFSNLDRLVRPTDFPDPVTLLSLALALARSGHFRHLFRDAGLVHENVELPL
jgi:hypothetical protein